MTTWNNGKSGAKLDLTSSTTPGLQIRVIGCCVAVPRSYWSAVPTPLFFYISQLVRDSFSVSQQPPNWEPPSHYSMAVPVEDGEPDHALRLLLHPVEEVESLDELVVPGGLEAGPHTRLHVRPAERLGLTQHAGNLHRGEVKLGLLLVNFIYF